MDSSDSLELDENLARFLAAYDQALDGGDGYAPTVHVSFPPVNSSSITTERPVTPLHPGAPNEGSLGELLPDPERSARMRTPLSLSPANGPHRIGRFELRRQLGKGGCGIVFLAYDPKLQREVALKVPRPEMIMNPDAKRRLKLEALAVSELNHPNLVPVYEWGEIGPICFIATAFCLGQTLAGWLDRQAFPVPVRQAARLVAIIADAVQHAHDHGVLHRDLKPNNVILQEMKVEENDEAPVGSVQMRGEYYVPRIVDFGLAKLSERGGPSETGTRQILGTPKYMAPEQAQARREDIGPPADVYALGVVLYELLSGRAPYDGASDVEVLRQSVEGKPVPPRHLRPDIPRDLEAICLKAMARTTSARYRTAIDLADDLRRFLDGLPTVARPLAWSGRAVRWLRRNDQIVAIAVLALIALFVTLLGTWNSYTTRNLRSERDDVVRRQEGRDRADQQREYAAQVSGAFHAWRSGNTKSALDALDGASRASAVLVEPTDFAHGYLTRLVKAERLMIVCPAGPVTALAVSPDGTRIASGHTDGTLAVWDRATGQLLDSVKAHDADLTHVGFARGGHLVVTLGRKQGSSAELLGWSVDAAGGVTAAPGGHRALGTEITCMMVSPDGSTVFAGDARGTVHKLYLPDAARNRTIPIGDGDYATTIAGSPDGRRLVIATAQGKTLRLSPALTSVDIDGSVRGGVTALAVDADGGYRMGFRDGGIVTFPTSRGTYVPTSERVRWIAPAPLGYAANTGPGRVVVRSGGWGELATGDPGTVRAGVFAPDGKTLFTGDADGIIRSWNLPSDVRGRGVTTVGRVTAIGVYPGGRPGNTAFVVATDTGLTDFEKGTGATVAVENGQRAFRAIQLLDDGTRRGVVFEGRAAVVCYVAGTIHERFRVKPMDDRAPTGAALTPDGAVLAVGDDAGQVSVWSVADRNSVGRIDTGHRAPVRDVVISNDGRYVAARTATGVGVWAPGTADPLAIIPGDQQAVFRFLPTSDRIVVAGRDGVVRVWNLMGREETSLFGHVGRVTGLGASPDGRTLVSGCTTGEVKFWDVRTGQELFGLRRHSVPVTVIEFAADGKFMVTGGDGQVAVWDARE